MKNKGVALFVSLVIMVLLSIASIVVLLSAYNYVSVTETQIKRGKALMLAQSGIDYAYYKIRINEDDDGNPMSDHFPGTCTLNPFPLMSGWQTVVDVIDDLSGNPKIINSKVTYTTLLSWIEPIIIGEDCSSNSQCASGNCYIDADGDKYVPSSGGTKKCQLNPKLAGDDCYDFNANAYPGSTYTSFTDRGDGSFDYNCVGTFSAIP